MFVGHALLAFAVAVVAADALGWSRERALAVGAVAGTFAMVPDVDIVYAPVGVLGADGVFAAAEGFWRAGNVVHRGVTHSLPVGAAAALAAGAWRAAADGARWGRPAAVLLLSVVVVAALAASGPLAAAVAVVFAGATLAGAALARRLGVDARDTALAAGVGLLSHPFGDLFTGAPPAFLFPFDATLVAHRVALHPDPTLHLLAATGVELATAWLAAAAYLRADDRCLREAVGARAAAGVAFAGGVFLLPAPTLETSYHFVFGVVGVGLVATAPLPTGGRPTAAGLRCDPGTACDRALTGLTAVTLAAAAYALAYVAVGPGPLAG